MTEPKVMKLTYDGLVKSIARRAEINPIDVENCLRNLFDILGDADRKHCNSLKRNKKSLGMTIWPDLPSVKFMIKESVKQRENREDK